MIALALALPLTAQGLDFSAAPDNTRVRTVRYTDNMVVRVVGYVGSPTVIEFGKSETVEDVAGGGIIDWDIAKVGNRVFYSTTQDGQARHDHCCNKQAFLCA